MFLWFCKVTFRLIIISLLFLLYLNSTVINRYADYWIFQTIKIIFKYLIITQVFLKLKKAIISKESKDFKNFDKISKDIINHSIENDLKRFPY